MAVTSDAPHPEGGSHPSPRPYPRTLPGIDYPRHFETRYVSTNGGIRWHKRWVNVSHVLAEE